MYRIFCLKKRPRARNFDSRFENLRSGSGSGLRKKSWIRIQLIRIRNTSKIKKSLCKKITSTHLAVALDVLGHLAGEDVSEGGEGVVHRLVVNGLVQVLDEHVAHAGPNQKILLQS